jgi:hypothetical protein
MQARSLPARSGAAWFKAAVALYRGNAPLLTSLTMLYLMVVVMLNFIPLLGSFVVPLLLPTLNLVMGNACRLIESKQTPSAELLTVYTRERRPALLRLGMLQLGGSVLLLLLTMLFEGSTPLLLESGQPDMEQMAAMLLRIFVLAIPLLLAFWFAPLLTGWQGVSPGKAVFFSLVACWRNLGAFFVYLLCIVTVSILLPGLVMAVFMLIAPDLMGGLTFILRTVLIVVLMPILMAGAYVSYRDVFQAVEPSQESTDNAIEDGDETEARVESRAE